MDGYFGYLEQPCAHSFQRLFYLCSKVEKHDWKWRAMLATRFIPTNGFSWEISSNMKGTEVSNEIVNSLFFFLQMLGSSYKLRLVEPNTYCTIAACRMMYLKSEHALPELESKVNLK